MTFAVNEKGLHLYNAKLDQTLEIPMPEEEAKKVFAKCSHWFEQVPE